MIDLITFFMQASDPIEYESKKLGLQVVAFLLIFAFIMWRVKKKIWKEAHEKKNNSKK